MEIGIDFRELANMLSKIPAMMRDLEELKAQVKFRDNLLIKQWVRREQALAITDWCDATLLKRANDDEAYEYGMIRRKYEGGKPLYNVEDIETYLICKGRLTPNEVREQILQKVA